MLSKEGHRSTNRCSARLALGQLQRSSHTGSLTRRQARRSSFTRKHVHTPCTHRAHTVRTPCAHHAYKVRTPRACGRWTWTRTCRRAALCGESCRSMRCTGMRPQRRSKPAFASASAGGADRCLPSRCGLVVIGSSPHTSARLTTRRRRSGRLAGKRAASGGSAASKASPQCRRRRSSALASSASPGKTRAAPHVGAPLRRSCFMRPARLMRRRKNGQSGRAICDGLCPQGGRRTS